LQVYIRKTFRKAQVCTFEGTEQSRREKVLSKWRKLETRIVVIKEYS